MYKMITLQLEESEFRTIVVFRAVELFGPSKLFVMDITD